MKPSITLRIPTPCGESWSAMKTTSTGKFCNQCSKELIDFTTFSNDQITDYFLTTTARVCGRFTPNQLNRNLLEEQEPSYASHLSLPALVLAASSLLLSPTSSAQVSSKTDVTIQKIADLGDTLIIRGRLIEESSMEVVYFHDIQLLVKDSVTQNQKTDIDGYFHFTVPKKYFPIWIRVDGKNYWNDTLIEISPHSCQNLMTIALTIIPFSPILKQAPITIKLDTTTIEEFYTIGDIRIEKKYWRRARRKQRRH